MKSSSFFQKSQQSIGDMSTGALALQAILAPLMNSSHVVMLSPFINKMQLFVMPMMMMPLIRDDELDESTSILYFISTADILPDIILVPLRNELFAPF